MNNQNLLNIVYQDEYIVVVNKPGGLLSIPGKGSDKQDCVTSRLKKLFPECIDQPSVHRLDMPTSGLLVLAFDQKSHSHLSKQFQNREVEKEYIAVVDGIIKENSGRIELPFRLDIDNRPYQIFDPVHGKIGITYWNKISEEGNYTRIQFLPLTGRTHQLRVHSASPIGLNAPIVGDSLYGKGKEGDQLNLCSVRLGFKHPTSSKNLMFSIKENF